jgi:hypothetical protein
MPRFALHWRLRREWVGEAFGLMSLIKTLAASSMSGLTPGGTVDWRRAEQLKRRASPLILPRFANFLQPFFNGLKLDPALKAARWGAGAALRGPGFTPGGMVDWRRVVAAPKARARHARRPADPAKGIANSQHFRRSPPELWVCGRSSPLEGIAIPFKV